MKILSILLLSVLLFNGCAEAIPSAEVFVTDNSYGFFGGLWHGLILPFSWLGSLFFEGIAIYAYDNNGGWYDFGFFLGIRMLIYISS